MANLAASAVTVIKEFTEGSWTGKYRNRKKLKLTLTGQGGATNKIEAATLGLLSIDSCSNGFDAQNSKIYPCVPSADGSLLHIADAANATATAQNGLLDLTSNAFHVEVAGPFK